MLKESSTGCCLPSSPTSQPRSSFTCHVGLRLSERRLTSSSFKFSEPVNFRVFGFSCGLDCAKSALNCSGIMLGFFKLCFFLQKLQFIRLIHLFFPIQRMRRRCVQRQFTIQLLGKRFLKMGSTNFFKQDVVSSLHMWKAEFR